MQSQFHMAYQHLEAIGHRLQGIARSSNHPPASIKIEDPLTDPHEEIYICGECAQTSSTKSGLASHFFTVHVRDVDQPCPCPQDGCKRRFLSQEICDNHFRKAHRVCCQHQGCEAVFRSGALLARHEKSHTQHSSNFQSRTCPHRGCGKVFPDQASCFAHYDGLHPLSVLLPGKKTPYKCPFAQRNTL